MIKKIDHIGIAVRDVESVTTYFEKGFGIKADYQIKLRSFHAAFLPIKETPLELIQDLSPEGVITKFIEKKGEGVHHIAFEVEDIHSVLKNFRSSGIRTLDDKPKEGAHDSIVAFLNPKDTYGILIELVEYGKTTDKPE